MLSLKLMTQHHQNTLKIRTQAKSLHKITHQVRDVVAASGISTGLCTLFVRHTSASLIIQENADPDVLKDFSSFFADLVPESRSYIHDTEGPDDMPAHIRSALTHTSEQIPIAHHRLVLGTWQGIYLWEHRAYPHQREIVVHVSGI